MSSSYEIQGQTVTLPVVVRDASSGTVMYMVDRDAARKIIPPEFEADEPAPGKTQLCIVIVDYRDNDLGDYNEIGVIFFVRPKGQPDAEVGSYIHHLPVNQSFTQQAGLEIWGFPKTVQSFSVAVSTPRQIRTNAFSSSSRATVVSSTWPGWTMVSAGSFKSTSMIECLRS